MWTPWPRHQRGGEGGISRAGSLAKRRVELHENLEVREVKGADGKTLPFQRETENPLYLLVTLPAPVAAGKR